MDKEDLKRLVLDEEKKGFIVYRTIEGLEKQELSEFVRQPIEGQLYDINRDTATCLAFIDEPMGVNNFASMVLIRHYYDRCKELEEKLKENTLRGVPNYDQKLFTIKWLMDNIDFNDKRFEDEFVELCIEENSSGRIVINCGEMYWTLIKSTVSEEWLCTLWNEPDTDSWIPSVKTVEDFKRLFRVATGFDLPYKNERT